MSYSNTAKDKSYVCYHIIRVVTVLSSRLVGVLAYTINSTEPQQWNILPRNWALLGSALLLTWRCNLHLCRDCMRLHSIYWYKCTMYKNTVYTSTRIKFSILIGVHQSSIGKLPPSMCGRSNAVSRSVFSKVRRGDCANTDFLSFSSTEGNFEIPLTVYVPRTATHRCGPRHPTGYSKGGNWP